MPTLTNKVLFLRSLAESWSVYASSTFTSGNPAGNVIIKRPGIYGRSTDTSSGTPAYMRLDAGSASAFDPDDILVFLAYARHDGTAGSLKYRVRTSTASDFSSTTYDSGSGGIAVDSPWAGRDWAHAVDNPSAAGGGAAARYLEASLWATSASYIDIGNVLVGEPWQPARNVQRGLTDLSPRERVGTLDGSRGSEYEIPGPRYSEAGGLLVFSDEADLRTEYNDMVTRIGGSGGVLYSGDPTDATYRQQQWLYGRLTQFGTVTIPDTGTWTVRYNIEEFH